MNRPIPLAVVLAFALTTAAATHAGAATIFADALADWDAARTNGLGMVGGDDTPEQGHPDTIGSGAWFYRGSGSPSSLFTSNNEPLVWDAPTDQYRWIGLFGINRTALSPPIGTGGSSANRPYVQRVWQSGVSGTVQVTGNFTNLSGPGTGVDVDIFVVRAGDTDLSPVDTTFAASGSESLDFDFQVELNAGDFVSFVTGPNGNHFNDAVLFGATITSAAIPEPAPALLATAGLAAALLHRRRRRPSRL